MGKKNQTVITRDDAKKQLKIVRQFDAPPPEVWKAWTESKTLDKWWAPKPWKAETKSMDFRAGGRWLYAMVGPEGEKHWASMDYETVNAPRSYAATDSFTDENGAKNAGMPGMHWTVDFSPAGSGTRVEVTATFTSTEQMDKIVEMGFKEGFSMAHDNLDALLEMEVAHK